MKTVIADDERMALLMLKKFTDWEGLGLTLAGEARDGQQLLSLIERERPDIVITDIKMPVFSGLEIIAKTLEMGLKPYFLITSAYTDFAFARQAMRLNVEDFLPKPVDKKELNDALRCIAEKIEKNGDNKDLVSGLVRNACQYIDMHFGEKLSLESISRHFYISPNYFSALFKKEMGVNFLEYLTNVRMSEAGKLLSDPKYSIAEIAEMTGYRDASHFGLNFSKKYGMTPSAWRRTQ
ncbi:MAG: helix-turn-helix domain-containing protein [Eubacteriales bacterium]|nr:helix-turn-helix domain-containing protein [Eubacteriales bacterium]